MFVVNDDMSIYLTRGDHVCLYVTATDNDKVHNFQPGDVLRFKVFDKKGCDNVAFEKYFSVLAETDTVAIVLTKEDTKIGEVINKPKDYWYEVELNPFTNPQTIIGYDDDGAKVFRLFPEGEDLEETPTDPEDIPVVDNELDVSSPRPVQNRAVVRGMLKLEGAIANAKEETGNVLSYAESIKDAVTVERARIDNLLSGATVDDAELLDLRVGANSNTYESSGTAVRSQFEASRDDLRKVMFDIQTLRLYGNFLSATLNSGVLNKSFRYRVSTDTILSFDKDITFNIADGFRVAIHEFKDGEMYADWGWRTGSVKVNAGVTFKCMIARSTDDTSEVADVNEFTNAITFDTDLVETKKASLQSAYTIDNAKARYFFETGDIKTDTGKDIDANHHRIRTKGICYTPNDIVIVANGLCRVYLYTFADDIYTNPVACGWVMDGYTDYTIPAGTYFRLLVAHLDDTDVSYDEILDVKVSDLYLNLEMYNKTQREREKSAFVHKSNIESVAHQGFSTTEQYYGNCRVSAVKGAYLNGFDCMEIDLQFTSDGIPVCCHDATFTDTNDNITVVTISSHTAEELKTYGYYGETIATLEEVLAECKRLGLGLYIDKVENISTDARWSNVFKAIKKYSMADKITWLAYNDKISAWDSKARFGLVVHEMNDGWITHAESIANKGHEVYLNVNHANCTVEQIIGYNEKLPANVNIGVWTIDDFATYEAYKPYVYAITSNKISDMMTNKN